MKKYILLVTAMVVTLSVWAQQTSSESMKSPSWAPPVPYDLGDTGVEQPVRWGIDTAWHWSWWPLRATNHMQECVSLGRVTLNPRVDAVHTTLSSDQISSFQEELSWLKKSGVTELYLLAGNASGQDWQTSFCTPFISDIALAVQHLQSLGYAVVCISPFNEPDYSANRAPDIAEQAAVARQMRLNSTLKNIDVCGPSTLNPDYGLSWWNSYGSSYQVGNTHQLSGTADSFANFYAAVQASGKKSTGDEMHNINDALVGMNYGMSEGIWWSDYGGYTRAELGRASNDGVRVGGGENRSTFTSTAVFRRKSQPLAEVFMGSSERQAADASYTFVSQDRLVYYDGEGPTYDFTAGTPGGTGYQVGQTNAETVIELTYGEDIPVGPIYGGTFKIVNKATGKLLTASSLSSGATLTQVPEQRSRIQTWVITPLQQRDAPDFAYATIMCAKSGTTPLYLDGVKWGADNGAAIQLFAGDRNECERWHLRYMGDGYYVLTNHDSGLSLEGSSNGTDSNTTGVVQWARTGSDRQLWRLVPAEATVESNPPVAPMGLQATSLSGSISLSWTANTESDLLGYMIYRYNAQAAQWECIARQVKGNRFIDNTCPKTTAQRYRIRAVDAAWNVSEPSDEVSCIIPNFQSSIGLWPLTESLNDLTENRLHATSTGVSHILRGGRNGVLFDGSDDYISLPYQVAHLSAMTFSAWIQPTSNAAWQRVFDFGRNTENYVMLTTSDGSAMRFEICKDGVKQGVNTTKSIPRGSWTHVAVTLGADGVAIYLNGELNASSADVTFRPSDIRPLLSYLGRSMFASDPLFRGYMSDVCLYNYAVPAQQVKALLYHEKMIVAEQLLNQPMYFKVRDHLDHSIAEAQNTIVSTADADAIKAALAAVDDACQQARASIAAYQPLVDALQRSAELAAAHPQSEAGALREYEDAFVPVQAQTYGGMYEEANIPTQVIAVQTFTNRYLMAEAVKNASDEHPVVITHLVENADFLTGTLAAWTLTTNEPSYTGGLSEGCLEVRNHTFELTQLLYGMPSGTYQLSVQGFYRDGAKENCATAEGQNALLFVEESAAPIYLITRGANSRSGDGTWYAYVTNRQVPDDITAAASAFNSLSRYRPTSTLNTVQADYKADTGQPLHIGLRKNVLVDDDWTVVNAFTLSYRGQSVETSVEPVYMNERQNDCEVIYDLQGRPVRGVLQSGVYIRDGKKFFVR